MGLDDGVRLKIFYNDDWWTYTVIKGCSGCVEFKFENPQNGKRLGSDSIHETHLPVIATFDEVATVLLKELEAGLVNA